MNIEIINDDIINVINSGQIDAVAHNCNCFHVMGIGIAKVLNEYTNNKLITEDKTTVYGDINKLGGYSVIKHDGIQYFNLYGMYTYKTMLKQPKPDNVYVHWDMLQHALYNAIIDSNANKFTVPIMGCSFAGGKYDDFIDMVERISKKIHNNVTLLIVYQ